MDLNIPLCQADSSKINKQNSSSPQRIIKRRRKRAWKPDGFLSQHLRLYEQEAKRISVHKNLRPQSSTKGGHKSRIIKQGKENEVPERYQGEENFEIRFK